MRVKKKSILLFSISASIINTMSDEQLDAWMELNDYMSNSPSCTGMSNHALLICKR